MIIIGLLDIVSNLLLWIVSFIPDNYPESLGNIVATVSTAVSGGVSILLYYFDTNFLGGILTFCLDFYIVYMSIRLIKYIISIIPVISSHADK